jgi:fructose-1,6-bisphosphatase/inositol monophosphatase family enzyme
MKPCLDEWVAFAEALADESRAMFGAASAPVVELKPDRSFVTDLDQRIEARLRELITDRYPAHGIIGEEGEDSGAARELTWVLDPVDGTAPFIPGVPVYGTLIALLADGVPVLGIIDLPVTGDRWVGATGRATRHRAGPCTTRRGTALGSASLSATRRAFDMLLSMPVQTALLEAAYRRPSRSDIDVAKLVELPEMARIKVFATDETEAAAKRAEFLARWQQIAAAVN